jgi:hypothetical protein
MVKNAEKNGKHFTNETMWESVSQMSEMLTEIKESHPDMYWKFMRSQAGLLNNCQYNEEFARWDVSEMKWHGRDKVEHTGEYWSCMQVKEATKDMQFPPSVSDWSKYVAFNATATDLCEILEDEKILKVAYEFWFRDEDWDTDSKDEFSPTKVWEYFVCKNS